MEHDISTANGIKMSKVPDEELVMERLAKLSSVIDVGRFFFENNRKTAFGKNKRRAYQGFRPKLFDCLVVVYNSYSVFLNNSEVPDKAKISDAKRQFVSLVQEVVDPNWFARKASYNTSLIKRNN
jgi:hypothetical protein